jgi:ABC-type uncharacterized transport system substrate-binding protein
MSAIVLSPVEKFINMSPNLEKIGFKNIHFYNSRGNDELTTPMVALVPFMDAVILEKDVPCTHFLTKLIEEAIARHIPVITEDCIGAMEGCL